MFKECLSFMFPHLVFSISPYMGNINGKQEIMVGYSDSAKDAGRIAACWAQYTAQEGRLQHGHVKDEFMLHPLTFYRLPLFTF